MHLKLIKNKQTNRNSPTRSIRDEHKHACLSKKTSLCLSSPNRISSSCWNSDCSVCFIILFSLTEILLWLSWPWGQGIQITHALIHRSLKCQEPHLGLTENMAHHPETVVSKVYSGIGRLSSFGERVSVFYNWRKSVQTRCLISREFQLLIQTCSCSFLYTQMTFLTFLCSRYGHVTANDTWVEIVGAIFRSGP